MNELFLLFSDTFDIFAFLGKYFVFWSPFVLVVILWKMWRRYLLRKWLSDINWVLLEIKLPKEIRKTPLAMELVLNSLNQPSTGPWIDPLLQGRVLDSFSLEIASIEGSVHFFIRTSTDFKNFIESQIYSQYPEAEVHEVSDYSRYINYRDDDSEWQPWGIEYKLEDSDPLPIATYVDYGLDKEGVKEEEKVDPLTSIIEFMATAGKDEQLWLQILIRSSDERFKKSGSWFGKQDWRAEGEQMIDQINKKYTSKEGAIDAGELRMTAADREKVKAITRNISKIGFDCGIRAFYWLKNPNKDNFDVSKVKALLNLFRPFDMDSYNRIKRARHTDFDFPWEDFMNIRRRYVKNNMFNAYKRRSYFYAPHKRKPFVLNAEELATIFHFPGTVAETPTFERIESRKGEPPTNLPT